MFLFGWSTINNLLELFELQGSSVEYGQGKNHKTLNGVHFMCINRLVEVFVAFMNHRSIYMYTQSVHIVSYVCRVLCRSLSLVSGYNLLFII